MCATRNQLVNARPRCRFSAMSEGAKAELIRKVFADANRVADVGSFDAWLDFFSEEIVWEAVEDAPDAGTTHTGNWIPSRQG